MGDEIQRLRNMIEIVLYHHPNVDDPIDYEAAYNDLKQQVKAEYDKDPWIDEDYIRLKNYFDSMKEEAHVHRQSEIVG